MNDEQRAELVDYIADELSFVNSEGMYSQANIRARAERIAGRAATVAEPDADRPYSLADMMREYQRGFRDSETINRQYQLEPDAETVERVAKAIFGEPDDYEDPPEMWGHLPEEWRESCRSQARAAIAAMPSSADAEWLDALKALTFSKRQKVYQLMRWNDRHAVQGDLLVKWPDALLGIKGEDVIAAITKAKEASTNG